jgi:DNA-binding CsgD family transcriptional regulator
MRAGRPKVELLLTEQERAQLQSFARSRSLPAALRQRARIALCRADGELNSTTAERLKLSHATVGQRRLRFVRVGQGVDHERTRWLHRGASDCGGACAPPQCQEH